MTRSNRSPPSPPTATPDDRQNHRRSDGQSRPGRHHHRRRGQDTSKPPSTWSKACSSTRAICRPYFATNTESMDRRCSKTRYVLIHEKKIGNLNDMLPLLQAVAKEGKPLAHHRGRRRRRSAGDAGDLNKHARHPQGLRGQGAGIRRPPQGHAPGHRRPDRRKLRDRRPRHQT